MTPEQAAHWRMLAEAHQDTPGDLAAAYRVIGELLEKLSNMQAAQGIAVFELQNVLELPAMNRLPTITHHVQKALNALSKGTS